MVTTDEAGAVLEEYTYSPYGESGGDDAGFPFRFTGQKLDPETGLYYYKARYYSPELGRFLQTDPIGYEDQMNLYAYVGNDPVNKYDPSGEASYLVSRPVNILGYRDNSHMFVIVVDDVTGEIVARYSYGPQGPAYNPGRLVSLTGSGTATDIDDNDASLAYLSDPAAAAEAGIVGIQINASDAAVIASGEAANEALGTREDPGPVRYAPVTGPQSTRDLGIVTQPRML